VWVRCGRGTLKLSPNTVGGMVMHGLVLNPNKGVAMEVKLLAEAIVLRDGNKLIAIGSRML